MRRLLFLQPGIVAVVFPVTPCPGIVLGGFVGHGRLCRQGGRTGVGARLAVLVLTAFSFRGLPGIRSVVFFVVLGHDARLLAVLALGRCGVVTGRSVPAVRDPPGAAVVIASQGQPLPLPLAFGVDTIERLVYVVVQDPKNGGGGGSVGGPAFRKIMTHLLQKYAVPPTGSTAPRPRVEW